MSSYSKELNSDVLGIKTPTVYDSNVEEWLMLAGNYIQNTSGIWVPQKGTDSGEALTHLAGNSIPEDEAIPTKLTGSTIPDSEPVPIKNIETTRTEISLAEQIAIADTNYYYLPNGVKTVFPDWNKHKNRALIYINSHDQPIDLIPVTNFRSVGGVGADILQKADKTYYSVTLGAYGEYFPILLTALDWPLLGQSVPNDLSFFLQANDTPTSGNITIRLALWD